MREVDNGRVCRAMRRRSSRGRVGKSVNSRRWSFGKLEVGWRFGKRRGVGWVRAVAPGGRMLFGKGEKGRTVGSEYAILSKGVGIDQLDVVLKGCVNGDKWLWKLGVGA